MFSHPGALEMDQTTDRGAVLTDFPFGILRIPYIEGVTYIIPLMGPVLPQAVGRQLRR